MPGFALERKQAASGKNRGSDDKKCSRGKGGNRSLELNKGHTFSPTGDPSRQYNGAPRGCRDGNSKSQVQSFKDPLRERSLGDFHFARTELEPLPFSVAEFTSSSLNFPTFLRVVSQKPAFIAQIPWR